MKILFSGVPGGIVMFVWTFDRPHGAAFGKAGTSEIPNESAVLSTMQSKIGERTVSIFFLVLRTGVTL